MLGIESQPGDSRECPGITCRLINVKSSSFLCVEGIPVHSCGRSSMVELQSSKLVTRVRFPSPALYSLVVISECFMDGGPCGKGAVLLRLLR